MPLYTREDAERCLSLFRPIEFESEVHLGNDVTLRLLPSGDIGRPHDLVLPGPSRIEKTDYLVVESTYGNRRHDTADPLVALAEIINRTGSREGVVVIPTFAVGGAQTLMYYLHLLKASKAIPDYPVYLNSPMVVDATRIFHQHRGEHRLTPAQCDALCGAAKIVNSVEESKRLNQSHGPMIILAASGMATGGRVAHHLKAFAPDPRNTILFTGFQAGGTRYAAASKKNYVGRVRYPIISSVKLWTEQPDTSEAYVIAVPIDR